eukprot:gene7725-7786_t
MKIMTRSALIALTLATGAFAVPAYADMVKYTASLSGAQEVPPTTSKGTGKIDITYDSATKTLSWKGAYADLTGPATAAHFHGPAEAGKNAGVEVPLKTVTSPLEGSAVLTDTQAADLMAGKLYFNIHTDANKGGEHNLCGDTATSSACLATTPPVTYEK